MKKINSAFITLKAKIKAKSARVGIIGVGYVGSALAGAVSGVGFETTGFDISKSKVDSINRTPDIAYKATTDFKKLTYADIICICVPTPTYHNKKPDLRPLIKASQTASKYLSSGKLVIIESTVGVGTTRDIVLPVLSRSGLAVEEDFFISFSPERIDPGNTKYTITNTPKVVSGYKEHSLQLAKDFYKSFISKIVTVSSLEAAEMTKLLENTFRFINISFINELSGYTSTRRLDILEIIGAASTKPYGFLAHYPGPGIGGHCIPVDPYYLLDDAYNFGHQLEMIEAAGKINDVRPKQIIKKTVEILKKRAPLNGHYNVLLMGITYKPDVTDLRESPALTIWSILNKKGVKVMYHDPYIARFGSLRSISLKKQFLEEIDLFLITTGHKAVDYRKILRSGKPVVDTRNTFNGLKSPNIYKL